MPVAAGVRGGVGEGRRDRAGSPAASAASPRAQSSSPRSRPAGRPAQHRQAFVEPPDGVLVGGPSTAVRGQPSHTARAAARARRRGPRTTWPPRAGDGRPRPGRRHPHPPACRAPPPRHGAAGAAEPAGSGRRPCRPRVRVRSDTGRRRRRAACRPPTVPTAPPARPAGHRQRRRATRCRAPCWCPHPVRPRLS